MKAFGFLSFGHYSNGPAGHGPDAHQMLHDAADIAVGAEEMGVNGAYFRVHHFAPQATAPMPLLSYIAAKTSRIEVGTGVIDMRYENPLYFAEEAAQLDLLADHRIALGVSRGSPEQADRGWESFGYTGSTDPRGADVAAEHFAQFLKAIEGEGMAPADPVQFGPNRSLPIMPQSPGLKERVWWGAGSHASAENAGRLGLNLMSSTLVLEATGEAFGDLQAEQIRRYKDAFRAAGHTHTPRVSVSRSIFPVVNEWDRRMFGLQGGEDQIASIDGYRTTFGRTYAGEPDELVAQLKNDRAVMEADTLMLTIPSQLGVEVNLHILENFAKHVAPELGWQPSTEGPVQGVALD